MSGALVPAKRTITDVRTLDYRTLLGHLRIPNGDLSEIHIQTDQKTQTVVIITKKEEDA